jgi:hypothetical protein
MTAEIELTRGYIAIVDDEDADLAQFNWSVNIARHTCYARRWENSKTRASLILHRVIVGRMLGRNLVKGEEVDHINHNGLDNRRSNLRLANSLENHRNVRISKSNTSGAKGVTWHKGTQKWNAKIRVNGHLTDLGLFTSVREAAIAYNEAAVKYFGEFAWLNPIPDEVRT